MTQKSTWAEISRGAVEHNLDAIRKQISKNTLVCAVVKADAYGHGLKGFVKMLAENNMVDMSAVGKISELRTLMDEKITGGMKVILLGTATAEEITEGLANGSLAEERCIFSVYSRAQAEKLNEAAVLKNVRVRVHIRIDVWDSGMGIGPDEFSRFEDELFSLSNVEVCGIYSHLYTSYSDNDEVTKDELERFSKTVTEMSAKHRRGVTVHVLNSALIFKFPEYAFDMVRAGTAMYGLPCKEEGKLIPAMKVCAKIFDVRYVPRAVPLSYSNVTDIDRKRRKIARIMYGYWDSPLLLTQEKVVINVNGKLYRPADEICMDNLCIDVTGDEDVKVGDVAVLMGEEGVSIYDILDRNGIQYVHSEWMCMTAGRLEKIYL